MPDINILTQDRLEELQEYLDEAPVDLTTVILHDALYELAYQSVIDDLTSEAEARREEERYDG